MNSDLEIGLVSEVRKVWIVERAGRAVAHAHGRDYSKRGSAIR